MFLGFPKTNIPQVHVYTVELAPPYKLHTQCIMYNGTDHPMGVHVHIHHHITILVKDNIIMI